MRRFFSSALVGLLFSSSALADCPTPYTAAQLGTDLSSMSTALRSGNPSAFRESGQAMTDALKCVDAPLAPVVLANVYRYAGLNAYFSGDTGSAEKWFRTALELDPTYDWDVSEVPVDDPIRPLFESARALGDQAPVAVGGGRALNVPDTHRLLVDGRALRDAKLTPDRPHLVQLIRKASNTVETVWLIDGTALPDSLLGSASDVAQVNSGTSTSGVMVEKIQRTRPPMKTPALVGGGLLMAGGVGLYALSFGAHKDWEEASTMSELTSKQTLTNGLVLGAGAALSVGVGLTWVGVSLDGGAGFHWRGQF